MVIIRIEGYRLPRTMVSIEKRVRAFALKPGVEEKIEQIRKDYYELLEQYPKIAAELRKDDEDFTKFGGDDANLESLFPGHLTGEDIPDKLDDNQTPLVRAKVMKSILDCQQALHDVDNDILMCREKGEDEEERTRELAFNFEKELLDIRLGIEEELNKLIET